MIDPIYLGDGVYAHDDGYHIVLTAGNHDPDLADAVIHLEEQVIAALGKYVAKRRQTRLIDDPDHGDGHEDSTGECEED